MSVDKLGEKFQSIQTLIQAESSSNSGDLDALAKEYYDKCPIVDGRDGTWSLESGTQPIDSHQFVGGRDIQFYKLDKEGTGVIYIPTFDPQSTDAGDGITGSCVTRFMIDAVLGVRNLTELGITKVLIDTSNNGGGYISLTQFLQRLFTGQDLLQYNNFNTLMVKAPLSQAIVHAEIPSPVLEQSDLTYSSPSKRQWPGIQNLASDEDFFEPGQSFEINGHTLQLSNNISDTVDDVISNAKRFAVPNDPPFKPENIHFVGNGLCASSCASFTNFLIEYFDGKAYVNNPQPDKQVEFQSSAAAQSTSSEALRYEAGQAGIESDLLPELKYSGTLGFAIRGAVSPNVAPGKFVQYRSYPAQKAYSLRQEEWSSPVANWEYIASQVY